jgi:nucleoside-diphosphate-sugar epimerase
MRAREGNDTMGDENTVQTASDEAGNAARPRVLVTGANGLIGGFVMDAWRAPGSRFAPVGLARQPGPNADIVADITDLGAVTAACDGIDAIVHLAASSAVGSPWEAVLSSNLIGTYNVFEAARRAGVPKVVFASSNHAIGTCELENAPALYDLDDGRDFDRRGDGPSLRRPVRIERRLPAHRRRPLAPRPFPPG